MILNVTVLDRIAAGLGYAPLARTLAAEEYASPWMNRDNLERITLAELFSFADASDMPVNRARAMQIGTVATGRHTICGTGGRLALYAEKDGRRVPQQPSLLKQLERGVPLSTTLSWIFDALIFYPSTWLVVTERDSYGWPSFVKWVPNSKARLDADGNLVAVGDDPVKDARDVIRIDSPLGEGLIKNGARTLRRALAIEDAAALAEDNPVPTIELHNEGDKLDKEQIETLMSLWQSSRRKRGVAYTSKGIKAIPHGAQSSQLLIDGRKALNLDVIRHMNIPTWVGAAANEGATMNYENRGSRNWELIDLTLSGYFSAIAGRLSMPDVTPNGWTVKFDTDDLTKPDQRTRFETYKLGLDGGFITPDWIAQQEGWPAALVPAPTNEEN